MKIKPEAANKVLNSGVSRMAGRILRRPAVFFLLGVLVLSGSCRSKPQYKQNTLPLAPGSDSGVYGDQYVQVDYGFGFPFPQKWIFAKLSADQEVDEVARFLDPSKILLARFSVQLRGSTPEFTVKTWASDIEQDLKSRQYQVLRKEPMVSWKTSDSNPWYEIPFHLEDSKKKAWCDEEWVLNREDLLIEAHVVIAQNQADSEKGKKLLKQLEVCLTQIHWFTPIGSRGISVERFELRRFTEDFCQALESRDLASFNVFFDEMYPELPQWNAWYQQATLGDPKTTELKAELSGLIINGDYATAIFSLTRKEKGGHSEKFEKGFKLSKKEGTWKIEVPIQKMK